MNIRLLILNISITIGLLSHPAGATPSIFHSTESGGPGDIIAIQGDNFGTAPQIWMQVVSGTESALSPRLQLDVLTSNSTAFVSAQIPLTSPAGLYAIWVKDGNDLSLSAPVYINRARAWGANDLCGTEIDPGRSFRLFGKNLSYPGITPSVRFISGTTSLPATVVSGTENSVYQLRVTAPAGLVPGTAYTITVNNGMGGTYGDSTMIGTVTNDVAATTLTARASGADPFDLNVPWGADFTFSGNQYNVKTDSRLAIKAVGDGVTNDAPAIQAAINTANAAGGGVVYIPAGTYKISGTGTLLTMKSNVVLQGEGMNGPNATILRASDTAIHGYRNIAGASVSKIGFADIAIYCTITGYDWSTELNTCTKVFALRTEFQTESTRNQKWDNNTQVLIRGCRFLAFQQDGITKVGPAVSIAGTQHLVFMDNYMNWFFGYAVLCPTTYGLVENNSFIRAVVTGTTKCQSGGLSNGIAHYYVVAKNTFGKSGNGPLGIYVDGQAMLSEGGATTRDQGVVTSASPLTLSSTNNWTCDFSAPILGYANQMYYVTIVSGQGTGQSRKIVSNTTNTLTVDSPWTVLPTAGSRYSIDLFQSMHELIVENTMTDQPQGIIHFVDSTKDVTIANNTLFNSGGIWMFADYKPDTVPPVCNVQMDTVITGNTITKLENTQNLYPGRLGSYARIMVQVGKTPNRTYFGTQLFGQEVRDNTVTAPVPNDETNMDGSGFGIRASTTSVDGSRVAIMGPICQGNTAINTQNGFRLSTGDYAAEFWDNELVITDPNIFNAQILMDGTGSGSSFGSVGTVIGGLPPSPWNTQDIGDVAASGVTSYGYPYPYVTSGTFSVIGSGADIYGTADEFQFAYQTGGTNCTIIARLVATGTSVSTAAHYGVMIRESLLPGSTHASMLITPGNMTQQWTYRTITDGTTGGPHAAMVAPTWVKVVRTGDTFKGYTSTDGINWTQFGTTRTIAMSGSTCYIGLAVTSHADGSYVEGSFDNVSITTP